MFERYDDLREKAGLKHSDVSKATGIPQSTFSDWKKGKSSPKHEKIRKLAAFFKVSPDYLMGVTDDPIDYDADGDAIAEIPLTYIEAANGDVKKARAIMLAADRDAQMDAQQRSGKLSRFSKQDAELIFALWGDTDDIDEKDLEDVRRFAAFIKERKKD